MKSIHRWCAGFLLICATGAWARSPDAQAALNDIEKTLGFVPAFLRAVPDLALPGAWEEMKTLQMSPNTALPGKVKELIGLAVAAQIPCKYCIYAHTEFAKVNGATQAELGEAVAMSALARHWSTQLNGIQTDETKFREELGKVVERAKNPPPNMSEPTRKPVVDAKSAYEDIQQSFGTVPEFLAKIP